jgi:hypothetical protein
LQHGKSVNRGGDTLISGPIITIWWLAPDQPHAANAAPLKSRNVPLGGYHSFAVSAPASVPSAKHLEWSQQDLVQLIFASHLILDGHGHARAGGVLPSCAELEGLSMGQRLMMRFHSFYSKFLLDLAVKRLQT